MKFLSNLKKDVVKKLSTLLDNEIELSSALLLLIETSKGREKEKIKELKKRIDKGINLSASFKVISEDKEFLNVLAIADKIGDMKKVFNILKEKYEFESNISKEILTLIVYPLSIFILASLIFIFMLLFIVPKFSDIYDQMGSKLPVLTLNILFLSKHIYLLLPFPLLFVFPYILYKKGKLNISLVREYVFLSFLNNMYANLSSGIDFLDAIRYSTKVNNEMLEKELGLAYTRLSKGHNLSKIFTNKKFFDREFLTYLSIGEKTGNMTRIFENMVDIYSKKLKTKIQIYLKLLEPILMLSISLLIGIVLLGIMLPIFKIGENIKI